MGSTPRKHRLQIPMSTRNSDIATLEQCEGKWFLEKLYEDKQAKASYFVLGDAVHQAIEATIEHEWDETQALSFLDAFIGTQIPGPNWTTIESSSRTWDTIFDDARALMGNWFKFVHPDSPDRRPIYDEYKWPPRTEVQFYRTDSKYPVWGSVDALFIAKDHSYAAIVDWKTGKAKLKDDDQLHFYRYGLDLQFPVVHAWYHRLAMVRASSVLQHAGPYPGDEAVQDRIAFAEDVKEEIVVEKKAPEFCPDWYCNFCVVQEFCPIEGENPEENLTKMNQMLQWAKPLVE